MKLARPTLTWKGDGEEEAKHIRLGTLETGAAAIVVADLQSGRTPTFTLQVLQQNQNQALPVLGARRWAQEG